MIRCLSVLCLLVLLGVSLSVSLGVAAPVAAQPWRQAAVDELVAVTAAHRLVLVGEMHGTRETPQVVADMVEQLSREAPLLLALEVHAREHASLRAYLDGDGSPAQRDVLRARPFWSVPAQGNDGRRSEDMLDLVEHVRQLRALGRDVAILPMDVANGVSRGAHWRDRAMAAHLRRAYEALPRGHLLVLAGNMHAMRLRPDYAPPQMPVPMGVDLQDLRPLSVEIAAATGAFWACDAVCGPIPVRAVPPAGVQGDASPFHYRIVLPRFTPARQVQPVTDGLGID